MKHMKFRYRLLCIFFAAILLVLPILSSCSSGTSIEAATLTIGIQNIPTTKNPWTATTTKQDQQALTLAYEPLLVNVATTGEKKPLIAESWDYDKASKSWTFHLRNCKFSDGTTLTAEDVKYSWETAWNVAGQHLTVKDYVDSIVVVDDRTIKFVLNEDIPAVLELFASCNIVPKHIWSEITDIMAYENEACVGTGPFKWTEYNPATHCTFVANPHYWQGEAKVKKVIFKLYGTDEAMLLALRKGDIDYPMFTELPSAVPTLMMDPNITVDFYQLNATRQIAFNHRIEPFNLKEVRHAINVVIPRQKVIDKSDQGYATIPMQVPLIPSLEFADTTLIWPYEDKTEEELIDLANEMMDAIPGMSAIGEDGLREYDGEKLSFENYLSGLSPDDLVLTEIVTTALKAIGIELIPSPNTYQLTYRAVHRNQGENLLEWTAFQTGTPKPASFLTYNNAWRTSPTESSVWPARSQPSWAFGWSNSTIQAKLTEELTESDPEAKLALQKEIQQLMYEEMPTVCIRHGLSIMSYRTDRFKGWNEDYMRGLWYAAFISGISSAYSIYALEPV